MRRKVTPGSAATEVLILALAGALLWWAGMTTHYWQGVVAATGVRLAVREGEG